MTLNISQGNLFSRLGDWKKALTSCEKALAKAIEMEDYWRQSLCYNNIAEIDYQPGRNEEAISKFRKAQAVLGDIQSHQVMFYSTLGIALGHHDMGNLDSSLYYIREASNIDIPDRAFTLHRDGTIFLAWIFAEREEWDSAYHYQLEVGYWRNSIDKLQVDDKLVELQVESRLEQKNNELQLSKELEEHHKAEIALKNRLLVAGIVIILLVIAVGFYLGSLVRRLRGGNEKIRRTTSRTSSKK